MNWAGLGLSGTGLEVTFRELEHFVRGVFHLRRADPGRELPEAELSEGERRAAVRREVARRFDTGP